VKRPHSLGPPLDWKRRIDLVDRSSRDGGPTRWGPHLIGNSVLVPTKSTVPRRPHSLGPPLDWKLTGVMGNMMPDSCKGPTRWGPHLIGNLAIASNSPGNSFSAGPTRWGPHLIGNLVAVIVHFCVVLWPHSLGPPLDWKLQELFAVDCLAGGPTRWGPYLIGNRVNIVALSCVVCSVAPLTGAPT